MCRLLAYAAVEKETVQSLLDSTEFESFRALATLHSDGWGESWLGEEASVPLRFNSVLSAADDQEFVQHTASNASSARMVHFRWATPGFPVRLENTHPFQADEWTFAHNGALKNPQRILALLDDEHQARLHGDTDSELFFQLIVQRISEMGDPEAGVRAAISDVRTYCGVGSLNCLLLSATVLVAVQAQGDAPAPVASLQRAAGDTGVLPEGHDEKYYKLRYVVRGGAIIIGSTGIAEKGWTDLGDDALIIVDLSTKNVRIAPLDQTYPAESFDLRDSAALT